MKTWWVCNVLLNRVDEEDLDTIDGSAAEGDDEIAPEVDVDDEPEEE